jgi:hypothetical protein
LVPTTDGAGATIEIIGSVEYRLLYIGLPLNGSQVQSLDREVPFHVSAFEEP